MVVTNRKQLEGRTITSTLKVFYSEVVAKIAMRNTSLGYWDFIKEVIRRPELREAKNVLRYLTKGYLEEEYDSRTNFFTYLLAAGLEAKHGYPNCDKVNALIEIKNTIDQFEDYRFVGDALERVFKKWPPCKAMST